MDRAAKQFERPLFRVLAGFPVNRVRPVLQAVSFALMFVMLSLQTGLN